MFEVNISCKIWKYMERYGKISIVGSYIDDSFQKELSY